MCLIKDYFVGGIREHSIYPQQFLQIFSRKLNTNPRQTPQKPRPRYCNFFALAQEPPPVQQARETSQDFSSQLPSTRFSESIRIGCTKIPVSNWMEEFTRMVSGKRDGKKNCLPTQRYDVTSVRVRKNIVSTFSAKLDEIRGQKQNSESMIIFQTVTLERF